MLKGKETCDECPCQTHPIHLPSFGRYRRGFAKSKGEKRKRSREKEKKNFRQPAQCRWLTRMRKKTSKRAVRRVILLLKKKRKSSGHKQKAHLCIHQKKAVKVRERIERRRDEQKAVVKKRHREVERRDFFLLPEESGLRSFLPFR
ncbi:hypothetical protein TGARI_225005 [Toxoplasma gondii ARI]|uniref:Uncharacterized protein n=1 Tax=Toxoplasma gondii ARI TaxID=1074872 RepID=A0A139XWH7_TOXGO|nr:hypothetical protein TGARI_225005 [Toxoplasma gondii ARI]